MQETGARLYRAAVLLSGDHHLAEDLTQTTYAKLFASWRKVRRAESPIAYAHRTLLNTFLSHQRLRRSGELPKAELPDVATSGSDTDQRLDLMAGLALIDPIDRAILVARYWEDHSVADTAQLLGLTETNVKTRARRALQRLRPHLSDPEGGAR